MTDEFYWDGGGFWRRNGPDHDRIEAQIGRVTPNGDGRWKAENLIRDGGPWEPELRSSRSSAELCVEAWALSCGLPVNERFANWVRRMREAKGWSRARLGKEAGVDHTTIADTEDGLRKPNKNTRGRLLALLSGRASGSSRADWAQLTSSPDAGVLTTILTRVSALEAAVEQLQRSPRL